jgi:hypothetical protein
VAVLTFSYNISILEFEKQFQFIGYDYGWFEGEQAAFSIIVNDILADRYQMGQFKKLLNNFMLFADLISIEKVRATRENLLRKGADLEREIENVTFFKPIKIWGIRDLSENKQDFIVL